MLSCRGRGRLRIGKMKSMFEKLITTAAMVVAMLLSSSVEAQSRIVVKRNGKTVIVVTQTRSRCETPRQRRVTPTRHVHRRGCQVRPPVRVRDARHFNRVKHRRNHHAHRCTTCIRYQRWLNWKPCRYNPVIHVCR